VTALDDLERYLAGAPILETWQGRYSARAHGLLLDGGLYVVCKPADEGTGHDEQHVKNEAAAWALVKQLRWTHLMGVTVVRRVPSFVHAGEEVLSSIQIAWPPGPGVPADQFSEQELLRAAAFDIIIRMEDRSQQNWLGIPKTDGTPRLILVDHAFAFGDRFGSQIAQLKNGERLPDDMRETLHQFVKRGPHADLRALLPEPRLQALVERVRGLLEGGTLALP
jgi:hypothetical protein